MSRTVRVGVFGAAGYAGLELIEILNKHPNVEIVFATSTTYYGQPVVGVDIELFYRKPEEVRVDAVDVVFLALPHKASAPVAAKALEKGVKVLDLSADLRLDTPEAYKQWYGIDHLHPELLPAPYGLPELNREAIRGANAVAVPGCYPTTTLLGLYPLLRVDGIESGAPIIVDAKSGVSGAGRSPSATTHFVEVYGDLKPYKTGRSHRHIGEIEQEIRKLTDFAGTLIFTPHLLPVDRGLMASIYVTLNFNILSDKVHSLYNNVYADEPMIQILPLGEDATLKHVVRTNTAAISVTPIDDSYLHITSVTDNLRKGASGQAVQCFNLMFDFVETTALL